MRNEEEYRIAGIKFVVVLINCDALRFISEGYSFANRSLVWRLWLLLWFWLFHKLIDVCYKYIFFPAIAKR